MSSDDLVFYVLDLIVFVMMVRWLRNTQKITVKAHTSMRWLVPVLFLAVMVIGFFRWEGTYSLVQTICLGAFAVMYWFVGSGISPEGIIVNGTLTKWADAGTVSVNKKDRTLYYKRNGKEAELHFDADQMDVVRRMTADAAERNHHR